MRAFTREWLVNHEARTQAGEQHNLQANEDVLKCERPRSCGPGTFGIKANSLNIGGRSKCPPRRLLNSDRRRKRPGVPPAPVKTLPFGSSLLPMNYGVSLGSAVSLAGSRIQRFTNGFGPADSLNPGSAARGNHIGLQRLCGRLWSGIGIKRAEINNTVPSSDHARELGSRACSLFIHERV
jgi:hypothetical protein